MDPECSVLFVTTLEPSFLLWMAAAAVLTIAATMLPGCSTAEEDGEDEEATPAMAEHRKKLETVFCIVDSVAQEHVWQFMEAYGAPCTLPGTLSFDEDVTDTEGASALHASLNIAIEDDEEAWRPMYVWVERTCVYNSDKKTTNVLLRVPRAGSPNVYTPYDEYVCLSAMRQAFIEQMRQ